ncbi:PQQ-dependent sugar dehydrogenase [Winogradskyella bathintestinalis]|uniref:PQQ-dependent sugar dehydrogenase n=1 Tax=Winogradskyella bathintestinalis TaxID=3035208 RepID=A0ABT7ZX54_9FLAO|nr:PQQ-dependent sugar dehydrogenase [Winogradskyella bathintestinalis]MDN3493592.1 PQQ-dependent sugar dehydrogenase [Winogradskyella bathintestinalis]
MRNHISKEHFGSLKSFIKSKSFKVRVALVIFTSVFLFNAIPYFSGSGLNSAKPIAPFANGVFPESIDTELDATYRVAFPNLTFFYPITFKMVPNQETVVLGQLNGVIFTFDNDETTTDKNVLLDLSGEVGLVSDGGFLGLTIHPEFDAPTNPKNFFYVYYTTKNGCGQDLPGFGQYTGQSCTYSDNEFQGNFLILEKFEVNPNTMTVVTNSRTTILRNKMYGTTHYGGGLDFGNDGFLYLTTGEMGSWSRAQDIANNLAGGVLRLDVDKKGGSISHAPIRKKQSIPIPNPLYNAGNPSCPEFLPGEISGLEYFIPNDNPFSDSTPGSLTSIYGQPNLTTSDPNDVYLVGDFYEEYYALGLRNPFRMTKDKLTGTFYIGDVGLDSQEEIDILEAGVNYGWPEYEGLIDGPGCDPNGNLFNLMPHKQPMSAFSSSDANSITGGFVYRGTGIPELYGKYICADYGSGDEIFSVDVTTGQYVEIATLTDVISFGEDNDGELYLLKLGNPTNIFKLIDDDVNGGGAAPILLSETGIFTNLPTLDPATTLTPIDGFVPYELYESFWSDGALKKRWIAVPNNDGVHSGPAEQIKYSEYGEWEFPPGTVVIKQFDLPIDDNDSSIIKKIETRFSVMGNDGKMYFLTYNWNDDQTDAVLQTTSLNEPVEITTIGGGTRTQMWHFPSNSECIDCHNDANKGNLGLRARYLNTEYDYSTHDSSGQISNQLVTLSHLGILDQPITDTDTPNILSNKSLQDPEATINEKARSYLDLNCAYCHRHDNSNRAEFDLRVFNSLEATELLTAGILNPLNIDPNEEIVYAGDASKSILYHRMNSVNPNVMMPPLAKTIIDQPAVDLIEAWIDQLDGNSTNTPNGPNPVSNLALLTSAQLSGSVSSGRGTPLDILYDPSVDDYKVITQFSEYGVPLNGSGSNLGTVNAENGFYWRVDWPSPKFVNYITFGGSYPNQRQQYTMWRVSYLRNGVWHTIEEGQGGWIDNSTGNNWSDTAIYEWDGTNEAPVYAEALRLQLYSDGTNDLYRIHLRGRGGNTQFSNGADVNTTPKASLMQFLPYDNFTTIDTIVAETQSTCNITDNTYSQELTVTYSNPPATGTLIINEQTFPITNSPQTLTLTGLDADGLEVDIEADFTDGYNSFYKDVNVFTAPSNCRNILIGVDETMIINGDYEVSSEGSIEILEGGSLTVNGNLTVNGQVNLNSISNKYSSLIVNGSSTGNIFYKRHVNGYNGVTGNDLISSPLTGENFGNFSSNNPNLYENPNNTQQKLFGPFNEFTGEYEIYSTMANDNTTLINGEGYRAARDTSEDALNGTTLTFYGGIETGVVSRNITTSGSSFDGWNLIGNPYSSYIDFDTFFNTIRTQLNIGAYQAIYGYDGDSSNGWTILNLNNIDTGQLIAPGQGFFVKSKSGGGTITFAPEIRVKGSADDFISGRTVSQNYGHLKLKASTINSDFYTDLYFNNNASTGLDPGYDAAFYGNTPPPFSLYTFLADNDDTPLTIQSLNDSALINGKVALGIHAIRGQEITINISESNLPDSINVYLEDASTNTFTLLSSENYTFTTTTNLTSNGRFFLNFESETLSTDKVSFEDLMIIANQKNRTVEIIGELLGKTWLNLYDIHGRTVVTKQLDISSTQQIINTSHLNSGIYIVELKTESGNKRIQKLMIK